MGKLNFDKNFILEGKYITNAENTQNYDGIIEIYNIKMDTNDPLKIFNSLDSKSLLNKHSFKFDGIQKNLNNSFIGIMEYNKDNKTLVIDGNLTKLEKQILDGKIEFKNINPENISGFGIINNITEHSEMTVLGKFYSNGNIFLDGNFDLTDKGINGSGKIYNTDSGKLLKDGKISLEY